MVFTDWFIYRLLNLFTSLINTQQCSVGNVSHRRDACEILLISDLVLAFACLIACGLLRPFVFFTCLCNDSK